MAGVPPDGEWTARVQVGDHLGPEGFLRGLLPMVQETLQNEDRG